jgi:hypothetical protein
MKVRGGQRTFMPGHRHGGIGDWTKHYEVKGPHGCHVWKGAKTKAGYGSMTKGNRRHYVHRMAWERQHGPIPPGKVIDHEVCDNPACMRVGHMKLTTQAENARRGQIRRWARVRSANGRPK